MKVVIIEDEVLSAEDLSHDLTSLNYGIQISAILPTVAQSIEYFSTNSDYNLIFSDIQLGDGYSFEIFKEVSVSSPIIFCTAYNQYAMEAFQSNGIDYIMKPFDKISLANTLEKYHVFKEKFSVPKINYGNLSTSLLPNMSKIHSLIVSHGDKILPIPMTNIGFFQIKNQMVQLHTLEGSHFRIFQSLEELEDRLGPEFYRINRQFIINRKVIKDVSRYFGRKLLVNLTQPFQEHIMISKEKAVHFLEWLAEN